MPEVSGTELNAALRRALVAIALAFATLAALVLSGTRPTDPQASADQSEAENTRDRASLRGPNKTLPYPLARLVPSDALAFESVSDLPQLFEKLGRTGLASLFEDDETGPFMQKVWREFLQRPWSVRIVDLRSMLQSLKLSLVGR